MSSCVGGDDVAHGLTLRRSVSVKAAPVLTSVRQPKRESGTENATADVRQRS
jgi:hypothetical protein